MISHSIYLHYLSALLDGNKVACHEIVKTLVESGIDARELYLDLIQKSMYRIGQLWEKSKASVATEHIATKITESMLDLVYPRILDVQKNGKTSIITCVDKEFHELGARIISDYLELKGWNSFFLGANTPRTDLIEFINEKNPDLVGISNNLYMNVARSYKLIAEIRELFPDLRIIVGGQALSFDNIMKLDEESGIKYIASFDDLDNYLKGFNSITPA